MVPWIMSLFMTKTKIIRCLKLLYTSTCLAYCKLTILIYRLGICIYIYIIPYFHKNTHFGIILPWRFPPRNWAQPRLVMHNRNLGALDLHTGCTRFQWRTIRVGTHSQMSTLQKPSGSTGEPCTSWGRPTGTKRWLLSTWWPSRYLFGLRKTEAVSACRMRSKTNSNLCQWLTRTYWLPIRTITLIQTIRSNNLYELRVWGFWDDRIEIGLNFARYECFNVDC